MSEVLERLTARQKLTKAAERGVRLQQGAAKKRAVAPGVASYDPTGAGFLRREADAMDGDAAELLTLSAVPAVGAGGELLAIPELEAEIPGLAHTVNNVDAVVADASYTRMELAAEAGCLTLALDAANGQASTSLEKMLLHPLAAAHGHSMSLVAKARQQLQQVSSWNNVARQQLASIEAARLTNAAARMMDSFQRGVLALDRLRNGGRQQVIVQHVNVSGDAKAIVAGAVESPRPGAARGGGDHEKRR